ncbi:MAG: methionyl-tRNA formyltransferase [Candidatus Eremiobacteraeota bacterium]|nr:methionyl-tRNA formyltransferase [Candidatus Eremiobacteraeota bacterium]MBC5826128.1 methionyl-tRNA formyltransferase [Candidatus Eremiobacteraeota bacterium]
MPSLRTVFFGSSVFAVPSFEALAERHNVVAAYTQPDRPAGRGLQLTPTRIKTAAMRLGIPVSAPGRLDQPTIDAIAELHPQMLVCASYGEILPAALLEIEAMTALNVHPSLLPRYRGATPIQTALREGAAQTGVTIICMTSKMDAGPIALAKPAAVDRLDTYGTLHDKLADLGAILVLEAADLLGSGCLARHPQDDSLATYTKALSSADRQVDFKSSAIDAVNLIRSLSPRPGAWALMQGRRIKIIAASAEPSLDRPSSPGTVVAIDGEGPLIATAHGALRLLRVVPEGKAEMAGSAFARNMRTGAVPARGDVN